VPHEDIFTPAKEAGNTAKGSNVCDTVGDRSFRETEFLRNDHTEKSQHG
jgi:hypothetical protein